MKDKFEAKQMKKTAAAKGGKEEGSSSKGFFDKLNKLREDDADKKTSRKAISAKKLVEDRGGKTSKSYKY